MALRRAELLGVKPAEATSAAVEGDFEVGVFGYFASVGAPNPVDEAARPRRTVARRLPLSRELFSGLGGRPEL